MPKDMDCDKSLISFDTYIANFESYTQEEISESDTRSKIIDCIMKDVLGWEESSIKREGHVESGYFDYVFSVRDFKFVVEAKKDCIDFVLPKHSRKVTLSTLYKQNKEVIEQIRGYITNLSLSSGVITNGRQFIIAQFVNTNGESWLSNNAYCFDGFKEIKDNFIDFWNLLSFNSVSSTRSIAKSERKIDFIKSIISSISTNDAEITRNQLAIAITPIIDQVFGCLYHSNAEEDDMGFIKQCYVDSLETNKNQQQINSIFSDDSPKLKEVSMAKTRQKISKELTKEIRNDRVSLSTPKPIIIVGTKGAGKSTFINHFFRSEKSQEGLSNHPYAIVDMMNYYTSNQSINKIQIIEDVINMIDKSHPELKIEEYSTYKNIYKGLIDKKNKGIWAPYIGDKDKHQALVADFITEKRQDPETHIVELNRYLIEQKGMRIIIAFDNADQLSDSIQSDIFLFAGTLNSKGRIGVLISLREGYYHKFRSKTPFNAFQSNVYHIAVPDYAEVLKKRLNYSIQLIKDSNTIENVYGCVDGQKVILSVDTIVSFFEALAKSTFLNVHKKILDYIRYTTFPNIREGLRVFSLFLTSGYTEIFKYILWISTDEGKSMGIIPFHEFVQSVGLENRLYYDANVSHVINLFNSPIAGDYFTPIVLLRYLNKEASINSSQYVVRKNLIDCFLELGYSEDEINDCLLFLIDKELIGTNNEVSDTQNSVSGIDIQNIYNITITAKGSYYISELINTFCYLDLIFQDTNIYDSTIFQSLLNHFPLRDENHKREMDKRIAFVECFLEYIKQEEIKHVHDAIINEYGSIVDNIYNNGLKCDIDKIERKLEELVMQQKESAADLT